MTVVAITGGTGAPGATTTALALLLAWPLAPGRRVLLAECDPDGGAVLAGALEGRVEAVYGLRNLAVADRRGRLAETLWEQLIDLSPDGSQQRLLLPGLTDPAQAPGLAYTWEPLIQACHELEARGCDVLLDLGRSGAFGASAALARRADAVLAVVRSTLRGVGSARPRVAALRADLDEQGTGADALGLVVVNEGPYPAAEVSRRLGTPVLGLLPHAPRLARVLSDGGEISDRRFVRSELLRAARSAADQVRLLAARRRLRLGIPEAPPAAPLADYAPQPAPPRPFPAAAPEPGQPGAGFLPSGPAATPPGAAFVPPAPGPGPAAPGPAPGTPGPAPAGYAAAQPGADARGGAPWEQAPSALAGVPRPAAPWAVPARPAPSAADSRSRPGASWDGGSWDGGSWDGASWSGAPPAPSRPGAAVPGASWDGASARPPAPSWTATWARDTAAPSEPAPARPPAPPSGRQSEGPPAPAAAARQEAASFPLAADAATTGRADAATAVRGTVGGAPSGSVPAAGGTPGLSETGAPGSVPAASRPDGSGTPGGPAPGGPAPGGPGTGVPGTGVPGPGAAGPAAGAAVPAALPREEVPGAW